MITLLIDTHSEEIMFLLYQNETLIKKIMKSEKKDHSTICIPTMINLLEQESLTIHDINDIIIVNGPGSFTGVRIGVTIAKTLAWTLKIPIRSITSLELNINFSSIDSYIGIVEKNGYYIARWNKKERKVSNYQYLNKDEYAKFIQENKVDFNENIDYENIIKYAHEKEPQKAHEVNPFYVKKIEVEK